MVIRTGGVGVSVQQVNQVEGVTRCNTFRLNGLILDDYNRIKMLFILLLALQLLLFHFSIDLYQI